MFYYNYYWGMNAIWWFVWLMLLIWIFATPYDIPFQRNRKDSPLDILQKRYATGNMTTEEYHEKKQTLEREYAK